MKKYLSALAGLALLFACTPEENGTSGTYETGNGEDNLAPSVTVVANHISAVSAVLAGKANLGSTVAADLQVGFQYSTSAGILPSNSTTIEATDADENYNYTSSITGLEPDTKYYFRSFVRQNGQDTYGETKNFTTKDVASLLETRDASGIEAAKATLNAKLDLTDIIAGNISYGFLWGTSESAMNNDYKCSAIYENAISAALESLSHKTQYWYKAYVTLDSQTFFGEVKSFTTDFVPVESVSLDKTEYTFNTIGNTLTLTATVLPADATDKTVTWTSSNASVATVDSEGKVTAVSKGTATIRATANDGSGEYASCSVTVIRPVATIELDKTSLVLYRGSSNVTETITATVNPSDASNTTVTWSSSNTSVATVSSSGVVTGISKGTATITVTANDGSGAQAACEVEVKQYVTSITLDKTSLSLVIGDEAAISVTSVLPENANDRSVAWSSSDNSVASVDNNGKVTAKAKGNATIMVTANDGSGISASSTVFVCPAVAVDLGLSVYWATANIGAASPEEYGDYYAWGETEPKEIYYWSTYNFGTSESGPFSKYNTSSSYGTVDNKTVLEPEDDVAHVKLGGSWRMPTDAEWTELRENCTWTWEYTPQGYTVTSKVNGNTLFLPAAGYCGDYSYPMSTNSSASYWTRTLASYSSSAYYLYGNVNSTPEVDTDSRYYGRSIRPVLVEKIVRATSISLSESTLSLTSDETAQLQVSVLPTGAVAMPLAWTSSNPAVATVDASGRVAAVADGTCTITVSTTEGTELSATCAVTVHTYVDLGLPSGTLWATTNIGATTPGDYGDYFAWGETTGYMATTASRTP